MDIHVHVYIHIYSLHDIESCRSVLLVIRSCTCTCTGQVYKMYVHVHVHVHVHLSFIIYMYIQYVLCLKTCRMVSEPLVFEVLVTLRFIKI